MATKLQVRHGTQAEWDIKPDTLSAGEIAVITDTNAVMVGNGTYEFQLNAVSGLMERDFTANGAVDALTPVRVRASDGKIEKIKVLSDGLNSAIDQTAAFSLNSPTIVPFAADKFLIVEANAIYVCTESSGVITFGSLQALTSMRGARVSATRGLIVDSSENAYMIDIDWNTLTCSVVAGSTVALGSSVANALSKGSITTLEEGVRYLYNGYSSNLDVIMMTISGDTISTSSPSNMSFSGPEGIIFCSYGTSLIYTNNNAKVFSTNQTSGVTSLIGDMNLDSSMGLKDGCRVNDQTIAVMRPVDLVNGTITDVTVLFFDLISRTMSASVSLDQLAGVTTTSAVPFIVNIEDDKIMVAVSDGTSYKYIIIGYDSVTKMAYVDSESFNTLTNSKTTVYSYYESTVSYLGNVFFAGNAAGSVGHMHLLKAGNVQDGANSMIGVTKASGNNTQVPVVLRGGVVSGFTGLNIGADHYYNAETGTYNTYGIGLKIGYAISPTELYIQY